MVFKEPILGRTFKIVTSRSLFNLILVHRFERYTTSDSQTHYAVAGYTTVYQYYAYPVSIKSISQHNDTEIKVVYRLVWLNLSIFIIGAYETTY